MIMTGIASASLSDGAATLRRLLERADAVEIPCPPLDELPYRDFVAALLGAPGFKLDFNRRTAADALTLVSDRIFGVGAFVDEREQLAAEIASLESFMRDLTGAWPFVSLRSYFAPGDLVWHVDRVNERTAFRLLWPLGRPAGMRVTPADNVREDLHRAYMRREHPLLCQLDSRVLRSGADVQTLWAHRPVQLDAMISGRFPFIVDPAREWAVRPGAISIHRVATPIRRGAYHRSSWANRQSPGLQIVITAASDQA
jgi:hypothetical protein